MVLELALRLTLILSLGFGEGEGQRGFDLVRRRLSSVVGLSKLKMVFDGEVRLIRRLNKLNFNISYLFNKISHMPRVQTDMNIA